VALACYCSHTVIVACKISKWTIQFSFLTETLVLTRFFWPGSLKGFKLYYNEKWFHCSENIQQYPNRTKDSPWQQGGWEMYLVYCLLSSWTSISLLLNSLSSFLIAAYKRMTESVLRHFVIITYYQYYSSIKDTQLGWLFTKRGLLCHYSHSWMGAEPIQSTEIK